MAVFLLLVVHLIVEMMVSWWLGLLTPKLAANSGIFRWMKSLITPSRMRLK